MVDNYLECDEEKEAIIDTILEMYQEDMSDDFEGLVALFSVKYAQEHDIDSNADYYPEVFVFIYEYLDKYKTTSPCDRSYYARVLAKNVYYYLTNPERDAIPALNELWETNAEVIAMTENNRVIRVIDEYTASIEGMMHSFDVEDVKCALRNGEASKVYFDLYQVFSESFGVTPADMCVVDHVLDKWRTWLKKDEKGFNKKFEEETSAFFKTLEHYLDDKADELEDLADMERYVPENFLA